MWSSGAFIWTRLIWIQQIPPAKCWTGLVSLQNTQCPRFHLVLPLKMKKIIIWHITFVSLYLVYTSSWGDPQTLSLCSPASCYSVFLELFSLKKTKRNTLPAAAVGKSAESEPKTVTVAGVTAKQWTESSAKMRGAFSGAVSTAQQNRW